MAVIPGTSLGICSKKSRYADLNAEKKALYDAAQQYFEKVLIIDPQQVLYFFERGATRPRILFQEQDLAVLSALIIRSTGGREASSAMLAHTLAFCGCDTVDPPERFSIGYASKLLTTISRFAQGIGTNSYIAFGAKSAIQLLKKLSISEKQPLLFKPAAGKKGVGVAVFSDLESALAFVEQTDPFHDKPEMPYLFQVYEKFIAEYRVMVMNGEILGVVEKKRAAGALTANAAQGGVFEAVQVPGMAAFVQLHINTQGLLGLDVAMDDAGDLHLIEANRAPMWHAFELATGVHVAEEVIKKIISKM
jgi:glutathione synthase/RimK-type ligase-like ATP-grasp enzyme